MRQSVALYLYIDKKTKQKSPICDGGAALEPFCLAYILNEVTVCS